MNRTVIRSTALLMITLLSGGLLAGCAWSIGSDRAAKVVSQPTRGQELIDLQKARDQGAINEDEYQTQRKRILEH